MTYVWGSSPLLSATFSIDNTEKSIYTIPMKYIFPKDKTISRQVTAVDLKKAFNYAKSDELQWVPDSIIMKMIEYLKLIDGEERKPGE